MQPMQQVIPRIYIGSMMAAGDYDNLYEHKITHIVNCCASDFPNPRQHTPFKETGIQYAILYTDDSIHEESQNPCRQWPAILEFITNAYEKNGHILIHCLAGVNRSVTTLSIWLVLNKFATSFDTAVEMIRTVRKHVNPIPSYREWAKDFLLAQKKKKLITNE